MEEVKINVARDALGDGDTEYYMCCSKTKASLLRFLVQCFMTVLIMGFCILQLSLGKTDPIYLNLILILTGIWLPSPKHE